MNQYNETITTLSHGEIDDVVGGASTSRTLTGVAAGAAAVGAALITVCPPAGAAALAVAATAEMFALLSASLGD